MMTKNETTPHTNEWFSNPKFPDAHTVKSHSTVLKEAVDLNTTIK
jgi:hypothetical protein